MDFVHKLYYKHLSKPVSKALYSIGMTPNKITVINFIFALSCGFYFFSRGTYIGNLSGLGVFVICVVLDYADGDIAKRYNMQSQFGLWLDGYGDLIIHNFVMAAVCLGILRSQSLFNQDTLTLWIIIYLVLNSTLQSISIHYNNRFGFDSYKGSEVFRIYMDQKHTLLNRFFKNIVDPTSSWIGLFLFTIRWVLVIGILTNMMLPAFIFILSVTAFRFVLMFLIYGLRLLEYDVLWIVQVLKKMEQRYEAVQYSI